MATFTLTGDIPNLVGLPLPARALSAHIASNASGGVLVVGDKIHLGGVKLPLQADGTFSLAGIPAVEGIHYQVTVSWVDPGAGKPQTKGLGWWESPAADAVVDLTEVVATDVMPIPEAAVIAELLEARDETLAARDDVVAVVASNDGIVSGLVDDSESLTSAALSATFAGRDRSIEPLPLREVTITARGSDPIPTDSFDGYIWGVNSGGVVSRSDDGGATWSAYTTVPNVAADAQDISRIMPCSDGEVLVVSQQRAQRSTNWASGSPTWSTVLTNPTTSLIYPWGVDGDGTKFVIVHYAGSSAGSPDRDQSRYGWISTDGGLTFTIKYDTDAIFGSAVNALTHIHGAAYDPWEDRFFISEGHDTATGVYVSTDDGDTWDLVPYDATFDVSPANSPTVVRPTDYGVVFGSDDPSNGAMVMPRGSLEISRAHSRMGISNTTLLGYAHQGARDPSTGAVYLCWEMNAAAAGDLPAAVTGSDGQVAVEVWADTDPARRLWRRIVLDGEGRFVAWEQSTNVLAHGKVGGAGSRPTSDSGRVLGGSVSGGRKSVAVGAEAVAVGNSSVVVGGGASTTTHNGTALGAETVVSGSGTAVGHAAQAEALGLAAGKDAFATNGTSLGNAAQTRSVSATAVGRNARAVTDADGPVVNATAVGRDAKASGAAGNTTAVGYAATASAHRTTALGASATATATEAVVIGATASGAGLRGTAVGYGATVNGHADSVALGHGTTTTAADQVMVGDRDIEISSLGVRGIIMASPDGTRYRVTVADGGTLTVTAV